MQRRNVKDLILDILDRQPHVTTGEVVRKTNISRQAVHAHLRQLAASGLLIREGAGRGTRYRLGSPPTSPIDAQTESHEARYTPAGLAEDEVWTEIAPELQRRRPLDDNAQAVFHYAFTELLNNAVEHAEAGSIRIRAHRIAQGLAFEIEDDGVGALARIRRTFGLPSDLDAVVELSKGKLTTCPERHTGEGIFFTSKAADRFELESGQLRWVVDNRIGDSGLSSCPPRQGTLVRFEAAARRAEPLEAIFDAYTVDFEFARTRALIKLLEYGTRLISRSEARRVCARLEQFQEVLLDFAGVAGVGQSFVDEVFRVFSRAHPEVRLHPLNMNEAVAFMVERGLHTAR